MASQAIERKSPHDGTRGPWSGFTPGLWTKEINVRDFIQQNVTPYDGDGAFLAGRDRADEGDLGEAAARCSSRSARRACSTSRRSRARSPRTTPGYIDKDNEIIVGLQTDAPLKRAIMPNGGFRLVLTALKTYGYEPDPAVVETFTKYRKTHNDAVFDAYTADIRRCRSSHILTGPSRRLRPRPDHRRLPPRGALRRRPADRAQEGGEGRARRRVVHRRDHPRPRGTGRADPRAGRTEGDGGEATASTSPARRGPPSEAVQWLYFGYLAGGEGAERRGHVAGPHLDLPRHLLRARPRGRDG